MERSRLIDLIHSQIPRRLRGRLDVHIQSDPYYLRTEVTVAGSDGVPWKSGPLQVTLEGGRLIDCKLPDWFVAHFCMIPVDDNRLAARLYDSLEVDEDLRLELTNKRNYYLTIER